MSKSARGWRVTGSGCGGRRRRRCRAEIELHNPPIKLLWLGPWHSDRALFKRRAVNQAATLWTRGLLRALQRAGCEVSVCTHCREQVWPQGDFWPGRADDFDQSVPLRRVRYANVPLLRDVWLSGAYQREVARQIREQRPDYVLSYNLAPYHCAVSGILKEQKVKWIPLILDQDDPEPDGWSAFKRQARDASGLVFLSHWGYRHCPVALPALHLDGGAEQWRGSEVASASAKAIVYSGKYDDRYGGLGMLFDIFSSVKVPGCTFLLTGKDPKRRLPKYLKREPRATYCGFVDECALDEIHKRATVFINPRPPGVSDNRMTFPSKLIHYLSYGKPVISSWTDGLAPEYRDVLLVPTTATAEDYARVAEKALSLDDGSRDRLRQKLREWLESTHTWQIQAERLLRWLIERVE